ncbi:hypothetical protein [Rhodoglobus aureus]|uniref:Uncharacterized protein n=1 Tax=Rhodoglobus aureus TaxID=191497 RepID=A0ABP4GFB2_9MICO
MKGRPTAVDEELTTHFARFLDLQASLSDTHVREQRSPAAKSSSLGLDDAATNPVQISHFVSYCLMQAVDMANSMRAMILREDGSLEVPVMALYPLVRAQIEGASMAAWVLAPPDRRTRILRRLQAGHDELTQDAALVRSSLGGKSATETSHVLRMEAQRQKAHKLHLRAVAAAQGIDPKEYENSRPSWETIVREAGEALGIENCKLVMMWRLASGFTHPSQRRGAIGLAHSSPEIDGNIVRSVLSARTDFTLTIIAISHRATDAALNKWHSAKVIH